MKFPQGAMRSLAMFQLGRRHSAEKERIIFASFLITGTEEDERE
jgi:hypothetical protein